MAHFKRKRPRHRRKGKFQNINGAPPDVIFSAAELRRLGGRARRVARRDTSWDFRDEGT